VTVRLAERNGEAEISVIDRGAGIPFEDLKNVFERFFRSRIARETEGLGLGLYMTRLIVEAHGGRVWVESAIGKGSTFHIALPTA
jgi:signal transduction histidine kinase